MGSMSTSVTNRPKPCVIGNNSPVTVDEITARLEVSANSKAMSALQVALRAQIKCQTVTFLNAPSIAVRSPGRLTPSSSADYWIGQQVRWPLI